MTDCINQLIEKMSKKVLVPNICHFVNMIFATLETSPL